MRIGASAAEEKREREQVELFTIARCCYTAAAAVAVAGPAFREQQ